MFRLSQGRVHFLTCSHVRWRSFGLTWASGLAGLSSQWAMGIAHSRAVLPTVAAIRQDPGGQLVGG